MDNVTQYKYTVFFQGTPQLVKLLKEQPCIKEKYLNAHEIVSKSVFANRCTISVFYANSVVCFRLHVNRRSYADLNYIKRFKSLYRKLKEQVEIQFNNERPDINFYNQSVKESQKDECGFKYGEMNLQFANRSLGKSILNEKLLRSFINN